MANVSSSNSQGERVPKLRFPGFEGEPYQQETVGTLFEHASRRNADGGISNVITNSAEHGLIPQRDFFDKDIAVEGNTNNYYIIKKGDFVYNPRKSTTAPYGPFNCYRRDDEGIVSPLYTCLTPVHGECTEYLLWYFKSPAWHSYIYHNGAQGGARHDRVGMTNDLMDGIPVNLPCLKEQEKICAFLSALDKRIDAQHKLVESLKSYKRGALLSFFPQEGESQPQYRLAGFLAPWKQCKMCDVFDFLQNNTLSRADLSPEPGDARNVHYGDVLIKFGEFTDVSETALPYIHSQQIVNKFKRSLLRNGDVIMADTAEDEAVGKCTEIAGLKDYPVVSGLHTIPLRPKEKFAPGYLGFFMNSRTYHDQLFPLMQGIKVTSISKSAIRNTDVFFPSDMNEQASIGRYFIRLSQLINLHERKYDVLLSMKHALLQQMLI